MILSIIPPHKEISPPLDRCLFVDPSNKLEIINSLNYVRGNIREIKARRAESREHSISNFSVDKMLDGYIKVYNSL